MTLIEIRALKQTARAKMEDLLGRTASREMSTEEKQMLTDLQAEGQRLTALETRYAALEAFDGGQPQPVRQPLNPTLDNTARLRALDHAFRIGRFEDGRMAADIPLQVQQSPVDAASAAAVPAEVAAIVNAIGAFDLPAALGVTEYPRLSTNKLVVPILGSATASGKYVEGAAPTESAIPTLKTVDLAGARYQNLTKVSIESVNNVGFDVVGAVSRALITGQLEKQNTDFAAALKTACAANSHALVDSGTSDAYYSLSRMITKLPAIFQGPGCKFLLSSDDLHACVNLRDDNKRPILDFNAGTLLGKPFVVSEDVDRTYYGNWTFGAMRSRTPLYVSVLKELYAEKALVGYSSYQFADWAFYSELTTLTKQPVVFTHLGTAGA